jgi:LysR family hydrogen peroxide-inducible transcriptional activator
MRTHPFSLRQLQYAVAVADAGGFRRAAERCHVSQPALSSQLAQLEQVLGVRLFERDRRRVLLAPGASEVIARARRVLGEADELRDASRRLGDPLAGSLRVGVIPTIAPYLVPSATRVLGEHYPRLTVLWVEDRTEPLMRGLREGTLEAAVVAREADLGEVASVTIAEDPFVLAVPAGHPLSALREPAMLSELRGASVLLLDEDHCLGRQSLAICTEGGVHPREFRATSLGTLTQMVAAGAGVTLLPMLAAGVEAGRALLRIRPFADPVPRRTIVLAWRPRSALAAVLRGVADAIREGYPRVSLTPPDAEAAAGGRGRVPGAAPGRARTGRRRGRGPGG